MRVVIDTNVVVSALLFGGGPGELISFWRSGSIHPYASRSVVDEYLRVLAYPKFNLAEMEIEYLLYREILPYFKLRSVTSGPAIIAEDPSDDIFIHCAMAADAENIISGDRYLLSLKKYKNIEIITVSQFLKRRFQPKYTDP